MTHDTQPLQKRPPNYPRPFPRQCVVCAQQQVFPRTISYQTEVPYEGVKYSIQIDNLVMPVCNACGEKIYTREVEDQILTQFRHQLHLLTPEQIRDGIARLSQTIQELSERLGIAEDILSRWADGLELQPRAMDNLLRLYFELPEVRAVLRGQDRNRTSGVSSTTSLTKPI